MIGESFKGDVLSKAEMLFLRYKLLS